MNLSICRFARRAGESPFAANIEQDPESSAECRQDCRFLFNACLQKLNVPLYIVKGRDTNISGTPLLTAKLSGKTTGKSEGGIAARRGFGTV